VGLNYSLVEFKQNKETVVFRKLLSCISSDEQKIIGKNNNDYTGIRNGNRSKRCDPHLIEVEEDIVVFRRKGGGGKGFVASVAGGSPRWSGVGNTF
jgi:hypothetical protein